LDEDCDGLTDAADVDDCPDTETNCFDGIDNDGDGPVDCADSDCDGATDSACDTGELGMCAIGTWQCQNNAEECLPDYQPQPEGPPEGGLCIDQQDNDCDGLTDGDDPDCQENWKGDANGDNIVDISDVILVLRMSLELDPEYVCADVDDSGAVNISDVILTLRKSLLLDPAEKCNGGI
jgi:hypothetical protein